MPYKNPDDQRRSSRESYHRHKERRRAEMNAAYDANPLAREASRRRSREWYAKNTERVRITGRAYRQKHKQKLQSFDRKRKYGVSDAEFKALLESQGGLCAICRRGRGTREFSVDHDHSTGLVRGLLCDPCNHGLGSFRDDPAILASAISYLGRS